VSSLLKKKAEIFKALSHPVRLAIVEKLAAQPRCVQEIAGWFGCTRTNVSKHLGVLRQSGIVKDHKEGLKVYYSLDLECLGPFMSCLNKEIKKKISQQYAACCGVQEDANRRALTIQVLGTNCRDCLAMEERAKKAAGSLGVDFEIIKVSELEEILTFGTAITPSLAVEGQLLYEGEVPSEDELVKALKDFLKEHQNIVRR
jgi:ArsR family transcriptional regulator